MKPFCFLLTLFIIAACSDAHYNEIQVDSKPSLYPDYIDVTIPKNIAPLNFTTSSYDSLQDISADIQLPDGSLFSYNGDKYIDIPESDWKHILTSAAGNSINIKVSEVKNSKKYIYKAFTINIADSEIDSFLSYRLIAPGYEIFTRMGIYCRNLTNFDQNTVIDNRLINANCVNCHSFCAGNPQYSSLHIRGDLNSTVIRSGGDFGVYRAVTDKYKLNCVYPYWHPSGKFVAYSQNNTMQSFHVGDPNRVEVYDAQSRVVIYDIDNNKLFTNDMINDTTTFTTEPSFSPDGNSLYYTTCKSTDANLFTKKLYYDICRIDFDATNREFSQNVDTLVKVSSDSMTTAFPRPSYDGKYLLFTKFNYGQFAIWHKEADLWMLNLKTKETYPLTLANSSDAESYHTWSNNSEWIAYESRRDDGLYTRIYIAHINSEGNADKAFLLPQKHPDFNRSLMYSYNVPEFSKTEFKINKSLLESRLKSGDKIQFGD